MPEPFKNLFSPTTVRHIAGRLALPEAFVADATRDLDTLELKDRVRHIAATLHDHLPQDYPAALDRLLDALPPASHDDRDVTEQIWVWPLNHFVQTWGLDDPDRSVPALQRLTQVFSAEFAIRPFLQRHPDSTLAALATWVDHPNVHVRRLVSEGTRPRLPWGIRLTAFQRDPSPTLPLLEALKDDREVYVRRSVANHLNDISKDHPDRAVAVGVAWLDGASADRAWVVRHALRGLVKQGHPGALAALGFAPPQLDATLRLGATTATVGETLAVHATLHSRADQRLVVDYIVHHQRANGTLSPKVFKWTHRTVKAGETVQLTKQHSLRRVTTRRYHPGLHRVELQVNGRSFGTADFELSTE